MTSPSESQKALLSASQDEEYASSSGNLNVITSSTQPLSLLESYSPAETDLDARAAMAFSVTERSFMDEIYYPKTENHSNEVFNPCSPSQQPFQNLSSPIKHSKGQSDTFTTGHENTKTEPLQQHDKFNIYTKTADISFRVNHSATADYLLFSQPKTSKYGHVKDEYYENSPRCMFYNAKLGSIYSNSLQTLDFRCMVTPAGLDQQSPAKLTNLLKSGVFWIDICAPTEDEMKSLSELFSIHPLTTEDILTLDTREKCELFPHYYFICIKTLDQDQFSQTFLQPILFYLVVFKECILTFHSHSVSHPKNVLKRINQLKPFGLLICSDWINYAIIDDIADTFQPILKFIEFEVDSIDDLVLILKESEQADMLRRIGHARKKVLLLMRILSTKPDLVKVIIKRCGDRMSIADETLLYLGDIQDHVITMAQNIAHFEKTLARAHSNYLAQISIEITQSSNRTNDIALKMTTLASFLLPMNIVTGLWGMNVKVPGQNDDDLAWFGCIFTGMVIFAIGTFLIVRKYYQLL